MQNRCMNKNNFSYWFPQVESCGIKAPKSKIFIVPPEIQRSYHMEAKGDYERIAAWVTSEIIPHMSEQQYFMKNAGFSNKFDFRNCITNKYKVINDVIAINYASLMLETDGEGELILREVIPHNPQNTPYIYHGMPLRNEFRVFYDFDNKKELYAVNYWDYDYVRPRLYTKTDQIVFDYMKESMKRVHNERVKEVEILVSKHMADVQLEGRWSVDILLDEKGEYWLIDMAVAERSAYWNPIYLH